MGPFATTALGILSGLIVFLAMAMMGVIAVNGVDNPGVTAAQASAAGGSTAGGGAGKPPAVPNGLYSLDLNADGALSLSEAAGASEIVTRFDRADRNRDGRLSKAEFERLEKLPPPKAKPRTRPQLRRDAEASLSALREQQ